MAINCQGFIKNTPSEILDSSRFKSSGKLGALGGATRTCGWVGVSIGVASAEPERAPRVGPSGRPFRKRQRDPRYLSNHTIDGGGFRLELRVCDLDTRLERRADRENWRWPRVRGGGIEQCDFGECKSGGLPSTPSGTEDRPHSH